MGGGVKGGVWGWGLVGVWGAGEGWSRERWVSDGESVWAGTTAGVGVVVGVEEGVW